MVSVLGAFKRICIHSFSARNMPKIEKLKYNIFTDIYQMKRQKRKDE
jgi:hypothetical protein